MKLIELIPEEEMERKNNRLFDILKIIWQNDRISRRELAQELNVSKVSILNYINKLTERDLVEEHVSTDPQHGRRPSFLTLKKNLFYSIGISFFRKNGSNVVLLDAQSEVVDEIKLTATGLSTVEKCEYAISGIKKLVHKNAIQLEKITGIGIALPGITNPTTGEIRSSSEFPDETSFNIAQYFRDHFEKDCYIINISHLNAFIEHKWGKAREMNSFLCLQSAFGLGMFLDGHLYRGHQFHAGELGGLQLQNTGPQHIDGRVGTLSTLGSLYFLTDRIGQVIKQGGNTLVKKYLPEGEIRVTELMLAKAIRDGDQLCAQMMSETFEVIGRAVVNLAYIFNPEAIFLPYWTEICPTATIDIVRRMMGHYGVSNWELKTDILSSTCTPCDFARGAALIPFERFFKGKRI
ncbi:MAG: hypothetical protein A2020_09850 [Lentisphaerae bacterium GWF2_45_14]|nr:MAG: hypothetical protein A2020_09850 [Lentisphaerae bacterium GWF2_45_14]